MYLFKVQANGDISNQTRFLKLWLENIIGPPTLNKFRYVRTVHILTVCYFQMLVHINTQMYKLDKRFKNSH
jgi:hypothetical protein